MARRKQSIIVGVALASALVAPGVVTWANASQRGECRPVSTASASSTPLTGGTGAATASESSEATGPTATAGPTSKATRRARATERRKVWRDRRGQVCTPPAGSGTTAPTGTATPDEEDTATAEPTDTTPTPAEDTSPTTGSGATTGTGGGTGAGTGGGAGGGTDPTADPTDSPSEEPTTAAPTAPAPTAPAPLEILGNTCENSDLPAHTGFQDGGRCVSTSMGEVPTEDKSPSLLITNSPNRVRQGQDFALTVSFRNLVRDRFLGAAAGGFLKESSFLDDDGLQRGHAHMACRTLTGGSQVAPDATPAPGFFFAIQDGGGGTTPDSVTVTVPGTKNGAAVFTTGSLVQCAVWAGDGSHRTPMMQRANQTPAFDVVRIRVS